MDQIRKYLDQEGVTTALRIAGWTWLALSVVLYMFLIDDTWRWTDTAGLVVIFRRSGADIALAAAGLMVPGVLGCWRPPCCGLAELAPSVTTLNRRSVVSSRDSMTFEERGKRSLVPLRSIGLIVLQVWLV